MSRPPRGLGAQCLCRGRLCVVVLVAWPHGGGRKEDVLRHVVGSRTLSTSPKVMSSLAVMLVAAAGLLLSSPMAKWHARVADVGRTEKARGAELRWAVGRRGRGGDRGSGL